MSKNAADRYHGKYEHWDMVELGWKANLTNIQAAMLRPQLGHLEARRAARATRSHRRYDEIRRPRSVASAAPARPGWRRARPAPLHGVDPAVAAAMTVLGLHGRAKASARR